MTKRILAAVFVLAASAAQADGIDGIFQTQANDDGNIGMVQQAAETTGEAARHIHDAATDLSSQSEQLKTQVDSFIAKIRGDAAA